MSKETIEFVVFFIIWSALSWWAAGKIVNIIWLIWVVNHQGGPPNQKKKARKR